MTKGRLEAFSDGVIAIIITIMALELKVPRGAELSALWPLIPVFFSYVLSFLFIGIYWNNHHHLMQAAKAVNGQVLWANLHLLFWLSLVPFTTGWMGQNDFAPWPVALYGAVLLLAGCSYTLLVRSLVTHHGQESLVATAIGSDLKGNLSLLIYAIGIPFSFVSSWIACAPVGVWKSRESTSTTSQCQGGDDPRSVGRGRIPGICRIQVLRHDSRRCPVSVLAVRSRAWPAGGVDRSQFAGSDAYGGCVRCRDKIYGSARCSGGGMLRNRFSGPVSVESDLQRQTNRTG